MAQAQVAEVPHGQQQAAEHDQQDAGQCRVAQRITGLPEQAGQHQQEQRHGADQWVQAGQFATLVGLAQPPQVEGLT